LVGPAWGADYVLAKTENTEEEAPYEEDLWVAGLEWGDSLGVEVVSSSLSYMDWYTYEDMDGNTAVTTIAADAAASRGIVMFNSNGNIRSVEYDKMRAPADGDSVLGIGAVTNDSSRSYFSSYGPTYDGRIKPDLMAMGSGVVVASPSAPDVYLMSSGTSFSCPMAAGIGALLLQVNRELTPGGMYQALKETASQSSNPDTVFGWGIINTLEAVNWVIASVPGRPRTQAPLSFSLSSPYPNPFNSAVRIEMSVEAPTLVSLFVYNVLGKRVAQLYRGQIAEGIHQFTWVPKGVSSGRYWIAGASTRGNRVVSVVYLR
jgi:serine protease AprX